MKIDHLCLLIFLLVPFLLRADDKDMDATLGLKTFLRPSRSIEITPTLNGTISEILVERGDRVEKGQPLIKVESAVIEAELAQAQAQAARKGRIEAAQAEVKQAERRLEIIEQLNSQGTSNTSEREKAKATLQIASGNFDAAVEDRQIQLLEVVRIEAELELRTLKSPIAGVVSDITRDVAESVSVGAEGDDRWLIRIVDLESLKATAHVPFRYASSLATGQSIELELGDGSGRIVSGTVHYISALVDAATGTREVEAIFQNKEGSLGSGIPATLKVSKSLEPEEVQQ